MHRNSHRIGIAVVAIACLTSSVAPAQAQSNLARCRLQTAAADMAMARFFIANRARCLRFSNYAPCEVHFPTDELRDAFETDECSDAFYTDSLPVSEIYPTGDLPLWTYEPDPLALREMGNRFARNNFGLDSKVVYDLDFPVDPPESAFERKCIRAAYTAMTKAIMTGISEQISCASHGGEPPWNCPIDTDGDSRLASALDGISRRVAKCRDSAGVSGRISGAAANMCNRAITTPDDLADCMRQIALCQICAHSISTLGTAHDCVAVSGDHDCNPSYSREFGKPLPGAFVVANEGDDSVTMFADAGSYLNDTLAASTATVGASPVGVAVSERTNVFVSVNRDDNSVTLLHAHDGAYLNGSLAASTVAVGLQPSAALVHPVADFLYVANRGGNSVTILDASDGSYAFGTYALSTFGSGGDGPSALALSTDGSILYVANSGAGNVAMLNARTGMPQYGSFATSTFVVGNAPSGLAVYSTDTGDRLAITNEDDDTVYLLDGETGQPADGTPAASTRTVGEGPVAIAGFDFNGPTLFVGTAGAPGISSLREGDQWLTNDGPVSTSTVALTEAPGGIALSPAHAYRSGAPVKLLVTSPATDSVFAMPVLNAYGIAGPSDAQRSMFPLPPNPLYIAANDVVPGFYVAYQPPNTYVDPLWFVDAAGEIQWEVPIPYARGLAYSAATDTIYVGTSAGVLYLNGSDGSYKFGTEAASTFSCGCKGAPRFVDEASETLYVTCDWSISYPNMSVAYMDAVDGSCTTAAMPTITIVTALEDVALDQDNGILYVAFSYKTGDDIRHVVVRHDSATGAYADGSYDDSIAWSSTHYDNPYDSTTDRVRIALSHDGAVLYVIDTIASALVAVDTATFTVDATLDTSTLGIGVPEKMFVGPTVGAPLMLFRRSAHTLATIPTNTYYDPYQPKFRDVVYLASDTLAPAAGNLADSRLVLDETEGTFGMAYNEAMGVVAELAYDEVENSYWNTPRENVGPGLILLDPETPSFSLSLSAREAGQPMATGDSPGAIAVMPTHTQLLVW